MHSVYVFDAYGTLFDTGAAAKRHAGSLGAKEREIAEIWRRKQLEYSWTRSMMGARTRDFWQLTEDALDWAMAKKDCRDEALRERLLDAYRDLDTFEEVPATLRRLKERGARLAILSNGSHAMLARAARSAGIASLFDAVLSADDAGCFKTDPRVYDLVTTRFRIYPDAVSFQSSNRWDVAGASRFGFHAVWINRGNEPDEYLDMPPSAVLPDLAGLPDLI